jgi:DNA (cytosine-5)-methyltransferase 1
MRYISVCAGIEAATQGWHHLGWEPVAFSEIEPFPSAVLKHHYPNVPNWGDMTQFKTWPDATIDVLVGGTPCQSFSIAGLRKGLEDPRGNLMLTFLGIADRYRPQWIVWENVPGVLSSNGGRDFGTFLAALGELGYGWAYRVLDAQWFGVAQRRRRVFVVGCLGDQRRAAAVLFESESVSRHSAPSRETRKRLATNAEASVGASSWWNGEDLAGTLTKQNANGAQRMPDKDNFGAVLMRQREGKDGGGKGPLISEEKSLTLATANDQVLAQPVAFRKSRRAQSVDDHETWVEDGITNTLNCFDVGDIRAVDVVAQPVAFDTYNQTINQHTSQTLGSSASDVNHYGAVLQPIPTSNDQVLAQPVAIGLDEEQNACVDGFGTLKARMEGGGFEGSVMTPAMQVRRLTPVECERLQGFPDNFTRIPWKKKPAEDCPDGPRYKALGNSMAVPCMRWIGERIDKLV